MPVIVEEIKNSVILIKYLIKDDTYYLPLLNIFGILPNKETCSMIFENYSLKHKGLNLLIDSHKNIAGEDETGEGETSGETESIP